MTLMEDRVWRQLRRCLLFFAPAGFLVSFTILILVTVTWDRVAIADLPKEGSGSFVKADMCTPGVQGRLVTVSGGLQGDLIVAVILFLVAVLTWLWWRGAPPGVLRVTALVVLVLLLVALIWVGVDFYISARNGLVWFAPRCGGGS